MTPERSRHRFASTRWSVVLAAGGLSPDADRALAELCETYWYPVYAFVRKSGHSSDDAADLTQAFFARVLEKRYVKDARPDRGRFRSFLLASLRHFMSNERDWQGAKKRGGGVPHVSLDVEIGEQRYQLDPPDDTTPERIYERRWTLTVLDRAMAELSKKYRQSGRRELYLRLKPCLTGENSLSYREIGEALGVSEGSLRIAVHRLRKEFASTLRAAIAETVERPEDIEDELRYLLGVVGRR
jgi:RNA polymerase sigma-70 factor (ECF subfamily)